MGDGRNGLESRGNGSGSRWLLALLTTVSWLLLIALWIWAILSQSAPSQDTLPRSLGRWVLPLALGLAAVWALRFCLGALRRGPAGKRAFLLVLAVALAVRLVGIDYEVEERAYRDEGTYYHHATKINEGQVFRYSFVYPHLLYYLDAFTLWNASLHPEAWDAVSRRVFDVSEALGKSWLALRLVAALLSVLAVAAVYRVGERFAPPGSSGALSGAICGALCAALLIFSPLYNDGSHLIISDVPSASLAAVSWMFAAGLLLEERRRDYLLAGVFAGLAAATKYPAGVVAVAIVAAWIRGRLRDRRWNWHLVLAGGASLGAFLLVMPTFFFHPRLAIFGDRGMLFGFRQYSGGGWIGVMPESIPAYYGAELVASFGPPALILGTVGLLFFRGGGSRNAGRREVLWLLVFPLLYLALIISMSMVVRRNLYPALPPLAALLGLGLAAGIGRLVLGVSESSDPSQPRSSFWRKGLAAGLVFSALVLPVRATLYQTLSLTRPSTRESAAAWIREHLPPGTAILKESYTPRRGLEQYALWQQRFVGRLPLEEIRHPSQDFLLLAKPAYGRFLREEALRKSHHFEISRRYREILDTFERVTEFPPSKRRRGPWLELYRIDNLPAPPVKNRNFAASEAFVPDLSMRPKGSPAVRFNAPGQWLSFKGSFYPGRYRLTPRGTFSEPPRLRLVDLGNQILAEELNPPFEARLSTRDKVLIYLFAEPEDRVRGLDVEFLGDS